MVSVYGYTTVAALELHAATDYGTVDATYTDGVVEAVISQAERYMNVIMGQSFTGTIPDAVVFVTLDVSYRMMFNRMIADGFLIMDGEEHQKRFEEYLSEDSQLMLKPFIKAQSATRTVWWT